MTVLYTGGDTHIHQWELTRPSGTGPQLSLSRAYLFGEMPSFLSFSRKSALLVCLSEEENHLCSVSIGSDGELSELSRVPCPGGPAYVSLTPDETFVVVASYGSGQTRLFPLGQDGRLENACATFDSGMYSHAAVMPHGTSQVFVPSKGSDSICVLQVSKKSLVEQTRVTTPQGTGPRHIVFSKDLSRAYVSCENDASLLAYACTKEADELSLREIAHVSSLPRAFAEGDSGSDVHLSSDDRFVYVSNRGHDSLSVFAVTESGVEFVQNEPTRGLVPRNFCLLGTDLVICANQQSSSLSFFGRDEHSGRLTHLSTVSVKERAFWVGNQDSY